MTYLTPGEQEAALASAFEAVLDEGGSRLAEVYAMNRRVRDRLALLLGDVCLTLEGDDPDLTHYASQEVATVLAALTDEGSKGHVPMLVVEWTDKT